MTPAEKSRDEKLLAAVERAGLQYDALRSTWEGMSRWHPLRRRRARAASEEGWQWYMALLRDARAEMQRSSYK